MLQAPARDPKTMLTLAGRSLQKDLYCARQTPVKGKGFSKGVS